MFKRIDHIELVPTDPARTIDFYTNILNFRIKSRHEMQTPPIKELVFLELGDSVVEIISVDDPQPGSDAPWFTGYRTIALEVENMQAAVDYLKDHGIDTSWGPFDLGNSWRAEIRDPDDLIIELREWK